MSIPVRIHINTIKGNKVQKLDHNLKPICNCEECYLNNCIREVELEKKQIENQKNTIKNNIDKFSIKNKNDINNLNLITLKKHIKKDVNNFKTYSIILSKIIFIYFAIIHAASAITFCKLEIVFDAAST